MRWAKFSETMLLLCGVVVAVAASMSGDSDASLAAIVLLTGWSVVQALKERPR